MDDLLGPLGHAGVVRHDDERLALLVQGQQQLQNRGAVLRVEVPRRLVGQQDERIVGQSSRNRHPLALAAAELGGMVREAVPQAHHVRQLVGPLQALPLVPTLVVHRDLDVLDDVELLDQVERLEDESDAGPADEGQLVVVQLRDVVAAQDVATFARPIETTQDIQQRGLARAAGTHDRDVLARLDAQVDAAEHLEFRRPEVIALSQLVEQQDGRVRLGRSPACGCTCSRMVGGHLPAPFVLTAGLVDSSFGGLNSTSSPTFRPERICTNTSLNAPVSTSRGSGPPPE